MTGFRQRAGITLIELTTVLAILGILGGIVTLGLRRAVPQAAVDDAATRIATARRDDLQRRRPVSVEIRGVGPSAGRATALPDGRIVADSALGGSRMTVLPNAR